MRAIIAAAALAASSMPTFALTLEDYPQYRVVWSLDCKNPTADRVDVKLDNITGSTARSYLTPESEKLPPPPEP